MMVGEYDAAIEMYMEAANIVKLDAGSYQKLVNNCIEKQTGEVKDHMESMIDYYNSKVNELTRKSLRSNFPKFIIPPYYPDDCCGICLSMDKLKIALDFDEKGK